MRREDKNGIKLQIGNKVKDKDGVVWKLANICGVSRLVTPVTGEIQKTQTLSKVDFTKMEKVA